MQKRMVFAINESYVEQFASLDSRFIYQILSKVINIILMFVI